MTSQTAVLSVRRKRGFTLTEIAIVLGIIGLILGAIWAAASAVYGNLRTSRATNELLAITQAVRAMYATSTTVDSGADMTVNGAQAGGALTYIQAGVFPADTVISGTTTSNPWSGGIAIDSAKVSITSDSFSVNFDNVPQSACIDLLTSNTGTGRDVGLYAVNAGAAGTLAFGSGASLTASTFPYTASTAQGKCTNNPSNVGFAFKLRG